MDIRFFIELLEVYIGKCLQIFLPYSKLMGKKDILLVKHGLCLTIRISSNQQLLFLAVACFGGGILLRQHAVTLILMIYKTLQFLKLFLLIRFFTALEKNIWPTYKVIAQ